VIGAQSNNRCRTVAARFLACLACQRICAIVYCETMSLVKGIGIGVAFIGVILCVASYYGRALRLGLTVFFSALAVGYPLIVRIVFGSFVNPMAAPWGQHTVFKVAFAGLLYALYPVAMLVLLRLSRSPLALGVVTQSWDKGKMDSGKAEATRRMWFLFPLVWLPVLFFAVQCIYLIVTFVEYPHPLATENLALLSAQPGFGWVLMHPTAAIHHTYAGATFLWSLALGNLLACFAFPIARWFVNITQRPRVMKFGSLVAAAAGVALAVLG